MKQNHRLIDVYEGWEGHQTSLVQAIAPLTREQLLWRPGDEFNSVGELARHISLGRLNWFVRMDAPGSAELAELIRVWEEDRDDNQHIVEKAVAISRQWTIWRILSHDIHHGGQIALMLGMQGIEAFELSGLFGHITLPPLADPL
jgi:uncharacterized damage-inducible protein DinB